MAKKKSKEKKDQNQVLEEESDDRSLVNEDIVGQIESYEEDPFLEKFTMIFLLVFLLLVIFVPGDWFNSLSMWLRSHIPGLK